MKDQEDEKECPFHPFIQHCIGHFSQCNQSRQRNKRHQIEMADVRLSLFRHHHLSGKSGGILRTS